MLYVPTFCNVSLSTRTVKSGTTILPLLLFSKCYICALMEVAKNKSGVMAYYFFPHHKRLGKSYVSSGDLDTLIAV